MKQIYSALTYARITTFILAILLILGFTFSKIRSEDETKRVSAVILTRMDVLYVGVDNPITIQCEGVHIDSLWPMISGGSIRPDSIPGSFIVRVDRPGICTINLTIRRGDQTKIMGTHRFRSKRIPDPVAYVNNMKFDGVMLKEDLQKISGVFSRMENFDFDFAFRVMSFKMSVQDSTGWKEFAANGPAITNEMRNALKSVDENQKIIFHDIVSSGPADEKRKISPVVITVK
jgi:GldM C-terminal domain